QKGSIGNDLWNSLLAAEKEFEAEILEVTTEANAYVEGWSTVIFQTATEMMHNETMRSVVEQIPHYSSRSWCVHVPRALSLST
ncbi:Pre protein translocase subunit Sec66-domain-containing protein, partial [Dichomitus squalens]